MSAWAHGGSPTVAVVVPHRDAPTLPRCLEAILGGTRRPDALVVVDDGSRQRPAVPQGATLLARAHAGPGAARNAGAAATDAEILVFVDADVVVAPDTLARLVSRLEGGADAVQAVYGRAPGPFAARLSNAIQRWQMLRVGARPLAGLSSYCAAVRRLPFEAAGGFDERTARPGIEDDNLGLRLASAGRRVVVAPEIAVTHLAAPSALGVVRRMRRMAHDRVVTRDTAWRHPPPPGTATHHPAASLLAAALAGGALVCPPLAPALLPLSAAVQAQLLVWLAREEGPAFAARAAVLLPALASGAAIGVATGLAAGAPRPA